MAQYKFGKRYQDGISFKMIKTSAKACGKVLREIAYDMFTDGYMYEDIITNIDEIIHMAHTPANISWLVETGFIEKVQIEMVYHLGQVFERSITNEKHILAQPYAEHACLIGLNDGNRLMDAIRVKNINAISGKEFTRICNNRRAEFAEV